MLRNEIKNWKELALTLQALIVIKPKMIDIRDFYTEELDYIVFTSLLFKKYGKPHTIIGIAEYFMSSIKDIFCYALEEDEFEILQLLDKAVYSQFTIFLYFIEIYVQEKEARDEIQDALFKIENAYNEFKVKQVNKYHNE